MLDAQNPDTLPTGYDGSQAIPVNVADIDFVNQLTQELFGGLPQYEPMCDPSYPEHTWLVVNINAKLGVSEILDQETVWMKRLWDRLGSRAGKFAISVYPESA